MKSCKLTIQINKSASYVFQFTLNPKNTSLWIDSILKEEVNETPTKIGTVYRNVNTEDKWSEYTVTQYEKNNYFELVSSDKNYHVKYTLTPLDSMKCKLEYFEWVESGQLESPFTIQILEKLKLVLESS
jgi:hypothetical protein